MLIRLLSVTLLLLVCGAVVLAWMWKPSAATHPNLKSAQLPSAIPLREFYANQDTKYGWSLSIDGKKLTWLETKWFKPLLRIKDLDSGKVADVRPPDGFLRYMWAADKRTILFTLDASGWEYQKIAAINTDVAEPELRVFDFGEETTAFVYFIPKQQSDEIVIAHNGKDPAKFDLYKLNVASGETEPFGAVAEQQIHYVFSNDGKIIARTVFPEPQDSRWSLQVQDESEEWAEIAHGDYRDTLFISGRPNEDGTISALSNRTTDKISFVRFNLRNGGETVLHSDPEVDIQNVLLDPKSNEALAAISYPGLQKYEFFDRTFSDDINSIDRPVSSALHVLTHTEDSNLLLAQIETAEAGYQTVLMNRSAGTREIISTPPISEYRESLSPVEPVSITAADGQEFQAFLSRPKGVSEAAPMVILVHGGPISHVRWGYHSFRAMLNNRGYAVLDVNYRGSTGYGRKFMESAKGEIAGKMSSDLVDARAWAVGQGYADPEKVAVFGISWGGFEVLTALTQNSDLFAAGISINGVADLSTMLDEVPDFWRGWREWLIEYAADPASEDGKRVLLEKSPIYNASEMSSPLLLVQAANDVRVVQGQSDRMVNELRKNDAPVDYQLIQGVGHSPATWPWQKRYLLMRDIEYFLRSIWAGVRVAMTMHLLVHMFCRSDFCPPPNFEP